MFVRLGVAQLKGMDLPMSSQEITLWLREDDDFSASLVGDSEAPMRQEEGWKVFLIQAPSEWSAVYLGPDNFVEKASVHFTQQGTTWVVSIK